jgi:hypothetical protein
MVPEARTKVGACCRLPTALTNPPSHTRVQPWLIIAAAVVQVGVYTSDQPYPSVYQRTAIFPHGELHAGRLWWQQGT